ncbi:MAG: cysteine dioxygenase [bacterium]|nr:cysteine dioxygenase [bacterium]MDE0416232.1 cysteine dioxygenase [bacterium]
MSRKEERDRAIAETLEKVRAVEGVTRQSLATIRDHMIALAQRRELFPEEDFPLPVDGTGEVFDVLSRDEDGRHELYIEVANKHVWTPPHNHTTWAVVVGIQGVELNRIWEGDGGPAGEAPLRLAREVEVRSGAGVCLMPNDFHSIHMEEGVRNMHLHLYGLGFAHLEGRLMFDQETGSYRSFD